MSESVLRFFHRWNNLFAYWTIRIVLNINEAKYGVVPHFVLVYEIAFSSSEVRLIKDLIRLSELTLS